MEKVICALWAEGDREGFNAKLLASLPDALRAAGATGIRINIRDEAVTAGAELIQQWQEPQQDAVVQYWLPSANNLFRGATDAAIATHCANFAAWLVVESTIIANTEHPPMPGVRNWGWSQASFISFREDIDPADAVEVWHSVHTRVAIETQSNFEYIQNLIIRPLTEGAPDYDAFVEECFPPEALSDPFVFFDSAGDQGKFDSNLAAMMESCRRFIAFGRIDIVPTSQFNFC